MDQVEEIKQKLDIVEVISSYVDLKKAGVNYKGLCPFHQEKTPSFMVNPERQIFKCFGCNLGGDIFTFIQEIEGVEFVDALEILAEKAGVRLKQVDKKYYNNKKDIYQLNELATKLFEHILNRQKIGQKPLKYLKSRSIKPKTIKKFRLGYSPNSWQTAVKFLTKKDYSQKDIIRAGLAIESQKDGSSYDRFRGRIIFPIFSPADWVVGFSSRILPEHDDGKMGKYINSPDTPVFNKSKILYGYNLARNMIRKKREVILVEGQFDLITSYQAGFENTVATSGTALTEDQLKLIGRIADRVIFAFDRDSAGQTATKRGINLALGQNLEVKVALIPGKFKDVDEVIRSDPKLWQKSLDSSQEIINYYFSQTIPKDTNKLTADQKKKIGQLLIKQINKINDPISRGDWIQRLAESLNIDQQYLYQAMEEIDSTGNSSEKPTESANLVKKTSREERLLGLIMTFPDLYDKIKGKIDQNIFQNTTLRKIFKKFNKKGISGLVDDDRAVADGLILEVEGEYEEEDLELATKELEQVALKVKENRREELKKKFAQQISQAEKAGDREKVKKLIQKFQKIITE
jgi:DNA primase